MQQSENSFLGKGAGAGAVFPQPCSRRAPQMQTPNCCTALEANQACQHLEPVQVLWVAIKPAEKPIGLARAHLADRVRHILLVHRPHAATLGQVGQMLGAAAAASWVQQLGAAGCGWAPAGAAAAAGCGALGGGEALRTLLLPRCAQLCVSRIVQS